MWIQEAKEMADLERRVQGYLAAPIIWMQLGKPPGIEGIDLQEDSQPMARGTGSSSKRVPFSRLGKNGYKASGRRSCEKS